MPTVTIYNNESFYNTVLHYLFTHYKDKIENFDYKHSTLIKSYDWRERRKENYVKICHPCDGRYIINYKNKDITLCLETLKQNGIYEKMVVPQGCSTNKDIILKMLTISIDDDDKEFLIQFIDTTNEFCENEMKHKFKSDKVSKTIEIHYWRKDFWNLLFKCPKRPLETLYLKQGQKEELIETVSEFYSENTQDEYIKYGIPYKQVVLIYGIPGSGKTSAIRTIASHFDADVYVIPVSKELTDYGLIDAISYMEEKEDKKRIIIIEDIDCIFTNRKKGDDENHISLQGLLNCFDGFSCVEGTLLFLTANHPEVLDDAVLRSCRIDKRFELGHADEYQTKSIFEMMLPDQKDHFQKFYKKIESKQFTTAMLQEFLFYNRKCENIYDKLHGFFEIIEKNKSGNYEKKQSSDLYM